MNKVSKLFDPGNLQNVIYFSFFGFILIISVYLFTITGAKIPAVLFSLPFILIIFWNIDKNYLFLLITSLFIGTYIYWPLRIQFINVVFLIVLLLFLFNINSGLFNNLKLPKIIKFSSGLFIFSVFLSSINSPGKSIFSVYLFFLFLTFIFSGYIVFKSIKDEFTVEKFFNYVFILMALTAVTGILEVVYTSILRPKAIMGWAIMDFSAIVSALLILKYFVLGKTNIKFTVFTILIFVVLILSLSRFAWIGFITSLIYGLIIVYKYEYSGNPLLKKRYIQIAIGCILLVLLGVILGVHNLIFARFSDVSFDFFEPAEEGYFQNSLETRLLIWFTALQAFQANPLTGVGYQMFAVLSEQYNVLPPFIFELFVQDLDAHNTMLSFLAETGIIGLCSFLFFIFTVYYYSFKSIKISISKETKANSILINVVIFFIIFNSIYSGQYTIGQHAFFMYMISGLCIGNYVLLQNKRNLLN